MDNDQSRAGEHGRNEGDAGKVLRCLLVERKGDDVVSMHDGQRIEFRIEGESDYETGTVVKAKKEWVRRDSDGSITGEGWINSWNPLDEPDDPTWLTKDDIELQTALDSLSSRGVSVSDWRPIETCDKSAVVIVWDDYYFMRFARYDFNRNLWITDLPYDDERGGVELQLNPTHWMPAPLAPK